MAKKETRRAARQAQKPRAPGPRYPTIRRSLVQGAILAIIYLFLVRFILTSDGRPIEVDIFWAVIFLFMYTGLIYVWEKFLFNRRQRKQSENE